MSQDLINEGKKKKKDREWKFGKGIKGTVKAALDHHPEKFSKEACKKGGKKGGKLCPYAVFAAKKKEGFTPHYKDQPSTLKGKPKKKKKYKNECVSFKEWLEQRDPLF